MATPAIIFDRVSKRYRIGSTRRSLRDGLSQQLGRLAGRGSEQSPEHDQIWALREVSFAVREGETLGIIGPNGAGKTTVLKLLSRITRPTEGDIQVNGRTSALIELGAGFHPDLTGRENIYLNASILGMRRQEIAERLDEIVSFAELEPFIDTPVKRYSSGMYARLGFSVAAHVDPDVLLVDEVLSVGDISFQQKCLKRIRDFQTEGKCIVFVSHSLDSIQKVCTRVIWLEGGTIASEGEPQEVVNEYVYDQMKKRRDTASSKPDELSAHYGTGKARIRGIQILDVDGHERERFDRHESMSIKIEYQASERIEPVNIFLIVTNDQGTKLSGTDFDRAKFEELPWLEGEGAVWCHMESLPFRPGAYFLIAGIENEGEILDRQGMAGTFVVEPDPEQIYLRRGRYGLFDVDSHWALDGTALRPVEPADACKSSRRKNTYE